jgi:cytochrome c553
MIRLAARGAMALAAGLALFATVPLTANEGEKPVKRDYSLVSVGAAPRTKFWEDHDGMPGADSKNAGCVSCHTATDRKTMHASEAVVLSCTDCHGGNAKITGDPSLKHDDPVYVAARDKAHVLPRYPQAWNWPSSANPKRGYALLNRESPEFIRFVNPSDYRVARAACGACHIDIITADRKSTRLNSSHNPATRMPSSA